MNDTLDEMKVLIRALREAEREEAKARHRQFGIDRRDIAAFSNIHPAQQGDKVRIANAPLVQDASAAKPSNWIDPSPLKTPYVDLVDRVALAFARREKEAALRERVKELTEEHQQLLALKKLRDAEG
jgi:hypothetical protein